MDRERWVIKTNLNRYVSIPFILGSGFKSFLDDAPVWNKTRTFHSEKEAEENMKKYLDPFDQHYVDSYSFKDGEKLIEIEKVYV